MDLSPFGVRATAGTLRASEGVVLHHTWTDEGVVAAPAGNGGQLLHLSVALCVLNDSYRRAGDATDVTSLCWGARTEPSILGLRAPAEARGWCDSCD